MWANWSFLTVRQRCLLTLTSFTAVRFWPSCCKTTTVSVSEWLIRVFTNGLPRLHISFSWPLLTKSRYCRPFQNSSLQVFSFLSLCPIASWLYLLHYSSFNLPSSLKIFINFLFLIVCCVFHFITSSNLSRVRCQAHESFSLIVQDYSVMSHF